MPSKAFFTTLTAEEKYILDAGCQVADKIIILSNHKADPVNFADDWFKASERAVNNSDWVMIAHSKHEYNESFDDLVLKFKDNPKPVLAVDFGEGA